MTAVKFSLTNIPPIWETRAKRVRLETGMPPIHRQYNVTISYKSNTAKIAYTTITDAVIPPVSSPSRRDDQRIICWRELDGERIGCHYGRRRHSIRADFGHPDSGVSAMSPTLTVNKSGKGVTTATLKPPKGLKKV